MKRPPAILVFVVAYAILLGLVWLAWGELGAAGLAILTGSAALALTVWAGIREELEAPDR